ncbi:MAG: NEW3 domain-containing protein [Candidatus Latescibacterota bacterium]
MIRAALLWALVAAVLSGTATVAAAEEPSLTKEQQLNKLRLQESQLLLEERRKGLESLAQELTTSKELFDRGYISLQKYKQIRNRHQEAKLSYEQAQTGFEQVKLDLLKTATHLVVLEARKYRTEDGKSMVDLVLQNASDTRDALMVDPSLTEADLRTLLKVENIYVSLVNGAIVGEPYEIRIPSLTVGQRETLTFRLLSDVEAVHVSLKYLGLTEDEDRPIILRKGSQQELPSINSSQFSQEGVLNQSVSFGLTLQRLADEERNFGLAVVGLPQRIRYAFLNQNAKVSQVKFDQTISKVQVQLRLEIPEKLDPGLIGRTRTFYALVTQPSEYAQIRTLIARYGDAPVPPEEMAALACNYVKLELIPKGTGKLEVLVANRYQEIKVGDELRIRVEFLNRGTVAVQNIKAVLDVPYEWESQADPTLIKLLEVDGRTPVEVVARPPEGIAVGDYELGIQAQGQVGTENVESLEKTITIRVGARSNIAGNTILIGLLVLLVIGIGVASIRISRR